MSSLLLDALSWDLVADASGNIAVADDPYATAQDVACAIRTVLAEAWYDTTLGIDYFGLFLGRVPSLALLKNDIVKAALSVATVTKARVVITGFVNRELVGQVQFYTTSSAKATTIPFSQVVLP